MLGQDVRNSGMVQSRVTFFNGGNSMISPFEKGGQGEFFSLYRVAKSATNKGKKLNHTVIRFIL